MRAVRMMAAAVLAMLAAACATVPMAAPAEDAAAKQFTAPPAGQAALYVYREGGVGGAVPFAVSIGQRQLGQLAPMTYFRVDLPAGAHDVRCTGSDNSDAALVALAPNETRFVELSVRLGVGMPRCSVKEAGTETARAAVGAGQRALDIR